MPPVLKRRHVLVEGLPEDANRLPLKCSLVDPLRLLPIIGVPALLKLGRLEPAPPGTVSTWSLDSGEKKDSDVPYQEPESTKSSGQRVHAAQACENTLRTGSAIPDNPGIREVIPSTSVGWAFVTKESPSP